MANAAVPEKAANPPQPPAPSRHQVSLTLDHGKPPCTLHFEGLFFEDHPEFFKIGNVVRIATEDSGGCAAGIVFDLSTEPAIDSDGLERHPLVAGFFKKPGQTLPKDVDAASWNEIQDLNFDDIADLCVVVETGAYNYGQRCWLFDEQTRTFVRHAELDDLIFVEVDHKTKKLKSAYRGGGPVYRNNEYEWQKGKLVKVFESIAYFGEKPDGTALPPGASFWLIRHELRGGKMVKTFDGALRDKQ